MQEGIFAIERKKILSRRLLDKITSLRKMSRQLSVAVECVLNFVELAPSDWRFLRLAHRGSSLIDSVERSECSGATTRRRGATLLTRCCRFAKFVVGHTTASQELRGASSRFAWGATTEGSIVDDLVVCLDVPPMLRRDYNGTVRPSRNQCWSSRFSVLPDTR